MKIYPFDENILFSAFFTTIPVWLCERVFEIAPHKREVEKGKNTTISRKKIIFSVLNNFTHLGLADVTFKKTPPHKREVGKGKNIPLTRFFSKKSEKSDYDFIGTIPMAEKKNSFYLPRGTC